MLKKIGKGWVVKLEPMLDRITMEALSAFIYTICSVTIMMIIAVMFGTTSSLFINTRAILILIGALALVVDISDRITNWSVQVKAWLGFRKRSYGYTMISHRATGLLDMNFDTLAVLLRECPEHFSIQHDSYKYIQYIHYSEDLHIPDEHIFSTCAWDYIDRGAKDVINIRLSYKDQRKLINMLRNTKYDEYYMHFKNKQFNGSKACIRATKSMQRVLDKAVDRQNKENEMVTRDCIEHAIDLVKAEIEKPISLTTGI